MKSIHRNRLPLVLFALLMTFFLVQKIDFNPTPVGHKRSDATFYYQIAQHVEAGPVRVPPVRKWPAVPGG